MFSFFNIINRMILQGDIWNAHSTSDHVGLLHSTRVISFSIMRSGKRTNVEEEGRETRECFNFGWNNKLKSLEYIK